MKTFHIAILYIFGILCLVTGCLLLVIPGRFLGFFGWAPVDPLLTRVFGAALLGMMWGCWRVVRSREVKTATTLAEIFFVFTILGSVGLLRHLLIAYYPFMVWFLWAVLLILGLLWAVIWLQLRKA